MNFRCLQLFFQHVSQVFSDARHFWLHSCAARLRPHVSCPGHWRHGTCDGVSGVGGVLRDAPADRAAGGVASGKRGEGGRFTIKEI